MTSITHISLNPHYDDLPEDVKNIEKYVFLHKELDYLVAKRRFIEEQIAFSMNLELKSELLAEICEIEDQIRYIRTQIPENKVTDLCTVIHSYLSVYRLCVKDVAKLSGVKEVTIQEALKNGFHTPESKKFAIWAILTFRLDANLYLRYLNLV